jgi:hypothetical protein
MDNNFNKNLETESISSNELTSKLHRIFIDSLVDAKKTASASKQKLNDEDVQQVLNTIGTDVTRVVSDSRESAASTITENDAHREIDLRNEANENATDYGKQVADSQRQNQGHTSHDKLMDLFKTALTTVPENAKLGDAPKQDASDQDLATYFGHQLASFAKTKHITDITTFNRGVEDAFQAGLDKNSSKG